VARELTRRFTTADASFLYVEKPGQPMHVGSCLVYEGHLSRDEVLRVMDERLGDLPRYRQRPVFSPFNLAHPTWEDDAEFDLARHVDELTLPEPGDDVTLSEVGGERYAELLDRRHPLWKLIVIHGRKDGNTAVMWMFHHALADGVSSVDAALAVHDLKRQGETRPASAPWTPRAVPDSTTLLEDAVRDRLTVAARQWTEAAFRWMRPADSIRRDRKVADAFASTAPTLLRPAPRTPFNRPISPRRQFAWAQFPFSEIREIRSALGGTINDIVLTVIAGALGDYLRTHGYPTDGVELRTMCPVNMRQGDDQATLGNLVSMMLAPLCVGIDDPLERLAAQREVMERLKAEDQAGSLYAMTGLASLMPPVWQALAAQFDVAVHPLNTVTSNVPGPQIPLYLAGRQLLHWYPLGVLSPNIGLFNAILSYNHALTIGATVDPALMPDVWRYASFLREAFDELRQAASAGMHQVEHQRTPAAHRRSPAPEERHERSRAS
jgi:diacylglycerol O-acyltransferase / wax synthase